MGEYSLKDQLGLEADYYIINGYVTNICTIPSDQLWGFDAIVRN